jgi:ABC-type dipeptide/oligopeptide/nickel transport system permease component
VGQKILRRLLSTIIVLTGVSLIAFSLVRLGGGDPARILLPADVTDAQVEAQREKMGLNDPLPVQYFRWIGGVLHADFGYSYTYNMEINELVSRRLPNTAVLALAGTIICLAISVPLGLAAGIKKGSVVDTIAIFFALLGQSLSPVWIAVVMILVFSVNMRWFPSQGIGTFKNLVMPAVCLGFGFTAMITRMLRSGMVDTLQEDYITATRARGISRLQVYTKYALKNAMLPTVTVAGAQLGAMLAGSVVIESIFGWPGLGQLMVNAINARDFQLVQSCLLISAFIFVMVNLTVDILYTLIDKRVEFN